ncbi:MAG: tetratricopeptide repeat protein, partial [Ilumatobacteraceae bacterium]
MTEPDAPRDQLPTDLAAAAEMRARHGFDIVQSDPSGARVELSAVLQDRRSPVIARLIAQWGLGRLLHDTGEVESAAAMLADAVDLAIAAGCRAEESQIRLSWAASLQATGDYDEAMAQLAIAEVGLRGAALGRLQMQRGLVLMNLGSTDAAIREYGRALPRLRTDGDRLGEARLLTNRGVALTQLGRNLLARADFVRAGELAEALGQHLIVAGAHHNLGYLHSRLGHVPEALTEYAEARRRYIELGSPGRLLAALDADQCDMDLFAGLSTEALQSAERLRVDAYESGNMMQLGEAHLLAARAHLLGGQPETARIEAKTAARLFIATGRTPWAAFAEYVEVVAAAVGGEATQAGLPTTSAAADGIEETINRLLRVAATLERMGWVAAAAEVQIQLAQRAITAGRLDVAGPALAAASVSRSHGTARLRAQAWHATALLHMVTGQPGRAKRAISSGLQVVDRYRATLGASELRVRASAIGVDLAALGLEIALRSGHPTEVFTAAERWRAGALAPRVKIGFVGDRRVDDDLIELRRLERHAREMMLDGQPSESSRAQVDARRAALVRIERRITERARLAAGDPRAVAGRLDIHRLRSELGDALMVEYIDFRGQIYGVVAGERRTRLVQLPKRDVVFELIDHLLFAVRRVAALPVRHSRVADALRALNQAAAELDELLVQPLRLQDRPLVVVPTGKLHGLP